MDTVWWLAGTIRASPPHSHQTWPVPEVRLRQNRTSALRRSPLPRMRNRCVIHNVEYPYELKCPSNAWIPGFIGLIFFSSVVPVGLWLARHNYTPKDLLFMIFA